MFISQTIQFRGERWISIHSVQQDDCVRISEWTSVFTWSTCGCNSQSASACSGEISYWYTVLSVFDIGFFVCVIICNCKGQSLQAQTDVTDYAWAHIDSRTLTMAEVCPLHSKNIVLKPVSEPPPVPRSGVVPQCGGRPLGCYLTRSSAGWENRPKEGLEWRGMW